MLAAISEKELILLIISALELKSLCKQGCGQNVYAVPACIYIITQLQTAFKINVLNIINNLHCFSPAAANKGSRYVDARRY